MRLPSIRSRLTLLMVGITLAWGLVMSAVVWWTVHGEVDELLDETLQASAEVMSRLLEAGDPASLRSAASAAQHVPPRHEHFAWQLVGPGGVVLLRSDRAPEKPWLPLPSAGFADAASGWRLYGLRLADGERMLYVAQTRDERSEAQAEVATSSVWAALAIGAVGALWLRRSVRRELRALDELSNQVEHYDPLHADRPLTPATRREVQLVQASIESLGARLARRVANERAFSAHAAHALRTPLAGMDTQLAVAQREAPDALQPRLARVRQAAARLTRVVTALLALFRSGSEIRPVVIDLHRLVQRLPHEGLALEVHDGQALTADEDLLSAALINLLDNSLHHGAAAVRIERVAAADRAGLRVVDDGRGCTAERRAELTAALREQAYEGRTGLGLMLADLVVRAHGGELRLPAVEQGFAVELLWPPPAAAGTEAAR